jgi:hypothetical protein
VLALGLTILGYHAHFVPGGGPPWLAVAQFGLPLAFALAYRFAFPRRSARWRQIPPPGATRVVGGRV